MNCVRQEYIAYGKEEPNESKKQVKRWQLDKSTLTDMEVVGWRAAASQTGKGKE